MWISKLIMHHKFINTIDNWLFKYFHNACEIYTFLLALDIFVISVYIYFLDLFQYNDDSQVNHSINRVLNYLLYTR